MNERPTPSDSRPDPRSRNGSGGSEASSAHSSRPFARGGSEATRSFRAQRGAPRSAPGPWRPRRASDSERQRLRAPASVATDWGPKLAGVFSRRASPRTGGRSSRYSAKLAGVSTQWERWERSDPVFPSAARRPAIGPRAVATAPSERQRAPAPASASERRHGLGAEARGGIQRSSRGYQRNGSGGSAATRSFRAQRGAPRSAPGPWRPRRASASERQRLRAPASVATDWGPKLAGVFSEARGGINAMGAVGAQRPGLSERSEAPRDRPPGRGDRAERAPASASACERQRASPRTGGRSSRGYSAKLAGVFSELAGVFSQRASPRTGGRSSRGYSISRRRPPG